MSRTATLTILSPEEKARRRKIKRMTGFESSTVLCSYCHKPLTDREIDNDDLIYSVGRIGHVVYHKCCFRELFAGGVILYLILKCKEVVQFEQSRVH